MKLFVWDFHGVLEKGNDEAVLEITNLALNHHGYSRKMTHSESIKLTGLRWHEYFSYLLPEFSENEYLQLQATCLKISESQPEIITKHISINEHVEFVLKSIKNSGHEQIVISNTTPTSLDMFIDLIGIESFFLSSHRFGVNCPSQKLRTKKDCLAEFVKDKKFSSLISIGDSPGDMALIENSFKIPGTAYLYSHPNRQHREACCHHKIHDLRAVLQEL